VYQEKLRDEAQRRKLSVLMKRMDLEALHSQGRTDEEPPSPSGNVHESADCDHLGESGKSLRPAKPNVPFSRFSPWQSDRLGVMVFLAILFVLCAKVKVATRGAGEAWACALTPRQRAEALGDAFDSAARASTG